MTNETKHTPGPWCIGGRYGDLKTEVLSKGHARAIAAVWTHAYYPAADKHRSTTPHPEGQANLALIAAAPVLLKALTVASRLLNEYVESHRGLAGGCSLEWQDAAYEARAALADASL